MSLHVERARVDCHWARVPVLKQCELRDDMRRSRMQLLRVHPCSRCLSPRLSACVQRTSTCSSRSITSGACSPAPASQTPNSLATDSSLIPPWQVAHIVASHCVSLEWYVHPRRSVVYDVSTTGAFVVGNSSSPSAGMLGGFERGCGNDSTNAGVGFWQSRH